MKALAVLPSVAFLAVVLATALLPHAPASTPKPPTIDAGAPTHVLDDIDDPAEARR